MSQVKIDHRVILIVGPTGVGKTKLSIELAGRINGEIISADSRYMYRGMDIGTAKPTPEERSSIPHHLIDIADPDDTWSLPRFLEVTYQLTEEIIKRGRIPIIVGGTGQYFRALTEGWQVPEMVANECLRRVLNEWAQHIGKEELHRKLSLIDPQAAAIIDATNVRRTVRALEVIFTTGKRFSDLRIKAGPSYDYWIIGLTIEREALYRKVDERIEEMFQRGLVEEVTTLVSLGYNPNLPAFSAIGYKEVVKFLNDELTLDDAKLMIKKNTRQFIRRQANWFKPGDSKIRWYKADPYPLDQIIFDLNLKGSS